MKKMRILAQGRNRLRPGDPPGLGYDSRGRHRAIRMIGDSIIVLLCRCGREYGLDFAKAKPMPIRGFGVELMLRRWADGSSGAPCPDCLTYYRKHGELPPMIGGDQTGYTDLADQMRAAHAKEGK